MHKITVDDIMAHYPCDEYPRERVEELWSGKESLTLTEILNLNTPARDRVWMVLQSLSKEENEHFARWSALQVTHLWDCPDVVKQYLETGDEELRDAAWNAARAAARTAGRDATWAAWNAWGARAAWNAAHASARASARAAADAAWDAWNAACTAADAAWNAAWSTWSANWATRFDAKKSDWEAAHAAAHAARGEEHQKQVEKLREMLECTK